MVLGKILCLLFYLNVCLYFEWNITFNDKEVTMKITVIIRTIVDIEVGMKVRYDCPSGSSEDVHSDRFFKKWRGHLGTIVGFFPEYIEPLHYTGRLPGVYNRNDCVRVQFDECDEAHVLKLIHCTLLSSVPTTGTQQVQPLPQPLLFYPEDIVVLFDDLLRSLRLVERVIISDDGVPTYVLAESEDDYSARKLKEAQKKEEGRVFPSGMMSFPRTESCFAEQLELVEKGNVHMLYEGSVSEMHFDSIENEVLFWARDGLSVHVADTGYPGCSLKAARELLKKEVGDIIVEVEYTSNDEPGFYHVRKLVPAFASHRDRVRSLAMSLKKPPQKPKLEPSEVFRTLARMGR